MTRTEKKTDQKTDQKMQLRLQAEKIAHQKDANPAYNLDGLSPEDAKKMLHELLIHQIELQMQNEELSRVQAELESSKARYFDLYDKAPVGYFTLNEDGLILESNQTAANLLGLPRAAIENKLVSNYIISEDQDIFYHHRQKLFATGRSQVCELRMKRHDETTAGRIFWARIESSVQGENHADPGRVVISDITENLRLAAQFQQSQKMESIGLLAGGVAHDYNNKLAVIIGYSELALNQDIPLQTIKLFLEEILKAAQLSATITRQLLTFARKQAIVPVIIDLNSTIEGMLKMLKQTVGEEIELVWRPESCLHQVRMDPVQIDQILVNLCINAKAAIAGIGRLTIETQNARFDAAFCSLNSGYLEGEFVMIEVTDTGCGMEEAIMAQIFEPFFTTRGIGQGTGLGLSTVDGIVKQNNGFITVASKTGVGTTFKIYLPRFTGSVTSRQLEKTDLMLPGCNETVLVVEDEPSLLPMIKMMIEKLGYRVLAANSPIAAIKLAETHQKNLHLLVTDVIMPEMNGGSLADMLQKMRPELKVLFMSGYSSNVLARRGMLESNVNFIQKPFSMQELAEKVEKATLSTACKSTSTYKQ